MATVIITGSAGLVGSECVRFFSAKGFRAIGIDNNMRAVLFGEEASSWAQTEACYRECPNFNAYGEDIRNSSAIHGIFKSESEHDIAAVIHCAAQPSHDWAASNPIVDFEINARGTLNLLEATRKHCPKAAFVFMSTNKVYGDRPNSDIQLYEAEARFKQCGYTDSMFEWNDSQNGFCEMLYVDDCKHSLFGCSKLAADLYVQEYGRYFGMNTVCFRGGCLTGPAHAGTQLHGFLSYLVKCCVEGIPYKIIGYGGKQVRDNIHSADLVAAFWEYIQNPKPGAVYNIGGGRENSCSVLEAIALVEELSGKKLQTEYVDQPRQGDHRWWITDTSKFQSDYPNWKQNYTLRQTVAEMVAAAQKRAA